jgi:hypothetical protein
MPFRVEVWNRERTRHEETLAASSSLPVARGAYLAACRLRPRDRILLYNLAQIFDDREPIHQVTPHADEKAAQPRGQAQEWEGKSEE